ncbi:hypothetical protein ES703_57668 [subsurface metagenome]
MNLGIKTLIKIVVMPPIIAPITITFLLWESFLNKSGNKAISLISFDVIKVSYTTIIMISQITDTRMSGEIWIKHKIKKIGPITKPPIIHGNLFPNLEVNFLDLSARYPIIGSFTPSIIEYIK